MNKLDCKMPFPNPYTVYINGQNVMDYGAVVETYKVSGSPITNSIFQGKNRTSFRELDYKIGMKTITLNLFYAADSQRELTINKSALDALMVGKIELHLSDGFYFSAVLSSAGELQMLGTEGRGLIALCSYTFQGIQHDPLQTVRSNTVFAEGTAPRMDCRLKCTATQDRAKMRVGTVTFSGIKDGDEVIADGIDGVLTVNGRHVVAEFVYLPYLVPGEQVIPCPEALTVEYFPTWV